MQGQQDRTRSCDCAQPRKGGRAGGTAWRRLLPAGGKLSGRANRRGGASCTRALTVAVDVHGAGVALAVVVGVHLGGVVHVWAVVAAVPHLVLVVVELARVEEQLAVVLRGEGRNWRNSPADALSSRGQGSKPAGRTGGASPAHS